MIVAKNLDQYSKAHLTFRRALTGRTYIAHQYLEYPFHITRPFYLDVDCPDLATLYLQSSSGGLIQGDRLQLMINVEQDAAVHFTTQAGTKVHSMDKGLAMQKTEINVESGGYLEYLIEPLILFPQARLVASCVVHIAADATLILSESFTSHNPNGGIVPAFELLKSELLIKRLDGTVLAIDRFCINQAGNSYATPGIADNSPAQGTVFVVSGKLSASELVIALRQVVVDIKNCYIGVSSLPNDSGAWLRLLAPNSSTLRSALRICWETCRALTTGLSWTSRRK